MTEVAEGEFLESGDPRRESCEMVAQATVAATKLAINDLSANTADVMAGIALAVAQIWVGNDDDDFESVLNSLVRSARANRAEHFRRKKAMLS